MFKITSIIIAEDDADDRLLIEDALNENSIASSNLIFVRDGEELLQILQDNPQNPSIVILDLNMPKKDGRQALKEIKQNNDLKHIPVIVFSTSSSADDIRSSYKNGVNTYFTKPSKYTELVAIIATVKDYWWDKAALV
ncbi:response regulator receiver protein [Fulvivirga imtechensis AK7]|uniref:Response regulator receiver protein n=1 Tax=Fulvivirga imtechensis AK7 TaxID=1237149 RepID=L8JP62_9BACT|nr:response regulator [Fulvivirga imtechensis]ELR69279.1 response regulator receiver protein [Fulvivirga imtechensis AK7]